MKLKRVKSKLIAKWGYDEEEGKLQILFKDEQLFEYSKVPTAIIEGMEAAKSKGEFFHAAIRGNPKYPFAKIVDGKAVTPPVIVSSPVYLALLKLSRMTCTAKNFAHNLWRCTGSEVLGKRVRYDASVALLKEVGGLDIHYLQAALVLAKERKV